MTLRPLPVAAVARFRGDVERLLARASDGTVPATMPRLALAVSGGPDSMAMLRLAADAFPGHIVAATFDHGLRAAAASEAALVDDTCAALGVPHRNLRATAPIAGSSIQMRARAARYAALREWAIEADSRFLLTAHHADDQAETVLMRLNRASGLSGLAAIRAIRFDAGVTVLRPLLDWRRGALRDLVRDSATRFVDDPSNDDPRHDRTRIRALLAATPTLDPVALAASATYLAEAEEALSQQAALVWARRWHGLDHAFAVAGESRDLRRRLLRRAIGEARDRLSIALPAFGDSSNVEPLLDALEAGRSAVQGGILVCATHEGWIFLAAPPRRSL